MYVQDPTDIIYARMHWANDYTSCQAIILHKT